MFRALVIAAALTTGACRDAQLAQLESLRDEVCACKTPACGEAAMKRVPQEDVKADLKAQKVAKAMMDCLGDLYLADRPSTDPDQEQPAAEGAAEGAPAGSGAAPAGSGAAPAGSGAAPAGSGAGSATSRGSSAPASAGTP